MSDFESKLAIVCHDAGGAEILSSYIKQQDINPYYCIEGPALGIFERKLGVVKPIPLDSAMAQAECFLCGTSWQSDLEWRVFEMARKMKKKTVAFLDHWVNYQERFIRNGVRHLPDEIWVGDSYAKEIATEEFPEIPVTLVSNPAFEDIRNQFQKIIIDDAPEGKGVGVLFLSDNLGEAMLKIHGDQRHLGYTDFDTLTYLIENIDVLGEAVSKITIRPHPSESAEKYRWAKEQYKGLVEIGGREALLEEIAQNKIVVGGDSMAMVVALLCKKRVISCIPPGGKGYSLPYDEIQKLQELIAATDVRY